jgi:phosphate transport system ATP-binding protein
MTSAAPKISVENLTVRAGEKVLLNRVSLDVRHGEILSVIGPAGSGKSTLLRVMNRLIDLDAGVTIEGDVRLDGTSLFAPTTDVTDIRRRIGVVFAVPAPLPMSIRDNLLLGPRFTRRAADAEARMESALRSAFLWDEVKDRLDLVGTRLSGGQQQRLCLARSLMLKPEIILLDEPCSGLDPISTAKIEEALQLLKKDMSVVLVTNNVKQASRTSDRTAFLLMGELVELDDTATLFTSPRERRTADYVSGRFG